MAKNVVCWVTSHSYELVGHNDADGDIWRCRRCAEIRYNIRRTGVSSDVAAGGGGFGW